MIIIYIALTIAICVLLSFAVAFTGAFMFQRFNSNEITKKKGNLNTFFPAPLTHFRFFMLPLPAKEGDEGAGCDL